MPSVTYALVTSTFSAHFVFSEIFFVKTADIFPKFNANLINIPKSGQ